MRKRPEKIPNSFFSWLVLTPYAIWLSSFRRNLPPLEINPRAYREKDHKNNRENRHGGESVGKWECMCTVRPRHTYMMSFTVPSPMHSLWRIPQRWLCRSCSSWEVPVSLGSCNSLSPECMCSDHTHLRWIPSGWILHGLAFLLEPTHPLTLQESDCIGRESSLVSPFWGVWELIFDLKPMGNKNPFLKGKDLNSIGMFICRIGFSICSTELPVPVLVWIVSIPSHESVMS